MVEKKALDQAHREPLSTRIITDAASWDAIGESWDELYSSSPSASTPLHRVWLRSWWEIYGRAYGRDGLRIVTIWRGPTLLAALPLYLGRCRGGIVGARELRFISTGEAEFEEICADYMNLLYRAEDGAASAALVCEAVSRMRWQRMELRDVPAESILVAAFQHGRAAALRVHVRSRGACAVADLEQGFAAYLAALSSKTRMRARQELRKFERSEATFELADASNAGDFFADLVRLHQQRWIADGEPGCFAAPRFLAFHRELVKHWIPAGRAVLARLVVEGQAVAVLYGFRHGPEFELYQLGVLRDAPGAIHSPGTVANLLLMSRLADDGVTHYDFLRGLSSFKRSLTTLERPLVSLLAARQGPRAILSSTLDGVTRIWRRIRRRIGRDGS